MIDFLNWNLTVLITTNKMMTKLERILASKAMFLKQLQDCFVGTIAFYVTLPPETIAVDTVIVFQTVNLNIGNG